MAVRKNTYRTKQPEDSTSIVVADPVVQPAESSQEVEAVIEKAKDKIVAKSFDSDQIVTVYNGFQGKLVYKSKKTGEKFVWDEFGSTQDMEVSELKSARSSGKNYFINNWFMFDDPEVVDFLGMRQYYKFALDINNFDDVFYMNEGEIEDVLRNISAGQKKSISYRAKQLINQGEIDSNRIIKKLEQCLNVELIER